MVEKSSVEKYLKRMSYGLIEDYKENQDEQLNFTITVNRKFKKIIVYYVHWYI
jgi:hypothetical protein